MSDNVGRDKMLEYVTPHFKWKEFYCGSIPTPGKYQLYVFDLATNLEVIREACGNMPVTIISGYRTEEVNKKCGGAQYSQHLLAKAADIQVKSLTPDRVWEVISGLIKDGKIHPGGLGRYDTFVHYDIGARRDWDERHNKKG